MHARHSCTTWSTSGRGHPDVAPVGRRSPWPGASRETTAHPDEPANSRARWAMWSLRLWEVRPCPTKTVGFVPVPADGTHSRPGTASSLTESSKRRSVTPSSTPTVWSKATVAMLGVQWCPRRSQLLAKVGTTNTRRDPTYDVSHEVLSGACTARRLKCARSVTSTASDGRKSASRTATRSTRPTGSVLIRTWRVRQNARPEREAALGPAAITVPAMA